MLGVHHGSHLVILPDWKWVHLPRLVMWEGGLEVMDEEISRQVGKPGRIVYYHVVFVYHPYNG